MEGGGRPLYYAVSGGASSRAGGSLNVRISSQIALFPSLLIPGRQLTAVGFKTPALRVANDDLPVEPSHTAHESDPDPAEMGLSRSPEEEPEAVLLGTIATGPWAVGTVAGSVIGGHRGRREATEIPSVLTGH